MAVIASPRVTRLNCCLAMVKLAAMNGEGGEPGLVRRADRQDFDPASASALGPSRPDYIGMAS